MLSAGTLIDRRDSRRKNVRYAHGNLFVTVKRHGFMNRFLKPQIVNWMDFNQFGMAFISDHKYNAGSELLIELSIDDLDDINKESVSEVIGIVTNVRRDAGNYRYGVKFDFGANEYMKSDAVRQSLMSIEHLLKDIFSRLHQKRYPTEGGHKP